MTATAKLFMHGRSQAVRLPKEFRMPGTEVNVRREGDRIVLEPVDASLFDVAAWFARLETYRDTPFPDAPDDPVAERDDTINLD
ncbi:MAG: antitoxin [Beijerinckiaceae bacterium]